MTKDLRSTTSLFTQVDISAGSTVDRTASGGSPEFEQARLLRELLTAQDRQNELMEELVTQMTSVASQIGLHQRQRQQELNAWKAAHPHLAKSCKKAADTLTQVQSEFLESLTREVEENADQLLDGEFILNEFVDRFGPRMAHLNGVLQVLSQLGAANQPAQNPSEA
jgi:uncharacterized phage infection (PIP) family protein YhgE